MATGADRTRLYLFMLVESTHTNDSWEPVVMFVPCAGSLAVLVVGFDEDGNRLGQHNPLGLVTFDVQFGQPLKPLRQVPVEIT